jgi:hypothetical protein
MPRRLVNSVEGVSPAGVRTVCLFRSRALTIDLLADGRSWDLLSIVR